MKSVKKVLLLLLIIFVVAQFFKPEKNEGSLESVVAFLDETKPPKHVQTILNNACFDCHSAVTNYPWYNKITPLNYWLASHIKEGKKHFNVSRWKDYSLNRKDHKIEELIEMVEAKQMPLASYTWTHSDAKLNAQQIEEVLQWAKQVRVMYGLVPKPQ